MSYPHLSPCTSGGMSMTITPPRGLTQKHCLGLQVMLQYLLQGGGGKLSKLRKVSLGFR